MKRNLPFDRVKEMKKERYDTEKKKGTKKANKHSFMYFIYITFMYLTS